ncbi:MAG: Fe-S cluster assembly protein SufD [Pseudomonadota bacterium]
MALAEFKNPSPYEARLRKEFAEGGRSDEAVRAWNAFAAAGLPHRRLEGWRWTDLRGALAEAGGESPAPVAPIELDALAIIRIENEDVTIEGGDDVAGLSARVVDGPPEPFASHAVSDLGRAFASQTVLIEVSGKIEQPILIIHRGGAGRNGDAVDIHVAPGGSARIVEIIQSAGGSFHHVGARIVLNESASLTRSVIQDAAEEAVLVGLASATLGANARFCQSSVALGGKLARLETHLKFDGDGASASIDSAALVSDSRHADFTTIVAHNAEACETRQRHKGVADGRGRAVFQGKFFVDRAGQRTDADMQANAILLSDGAQANHKPELEIYADDVECAHGSTCGALDDGALFYLRQRGLDEASARALLIEAFVGEILDDMDAAAAPAARAMVENWLEARGR